MKGTVVIGEGETASWEEGALAGETEVVPAGEGAVPLEGGAGGALRGLKPSFLIIAFAITWLAASVGWYSSQNTYLLRSLHRLDAGVHVSDGRILPNLQHGESALLNPVKNSQKRFLISFCGSAKRGIEY